MKTITSTDLVLYPRTMLDLQALKESCKQYVSTLSQYEQDLAEQYGIFLKNSSKSNKKQLFLKTLANRLMTMGRNGGKKTIAISLVNAALVRIHKTLSLNPVHVVLDVLLKNAPFVDIRFVKQGSISVSKKVFLSQHRRAALVIKKFKNGKRVQKAHISFAQEIILAYNHDSRSKLVAYNTQLIKDAKQASE